MADKRWFCGAPIEGMSGKRYLMRDRVFGWGPIMVIARDYMIYLADDPESPGVAAGRISSWVEFKEDGNG